MPAGNEGPWLREHKIALLGVFAALAAGPWVPNVCHAWFGSGGPAVTITSPANGPVSTNNFAVAGTAKGIPANDQLWIFEQTSNDTNWFPTSAVMVANGKWILRAGKICLTDTDKADVWAVDIPDDSAAPVNNYLRNPQKWGKHGLPELPAGSDRLASVTVTFPRKTSCD